MKECVRMIRAEAYKMRGTGFFPLHVLIPFSGVLIFLAYYGYHDFTPGKEWAWYIEAVSVVFPVMVSTVCALSAGVEEKNHYIMFLGTAVQKKNSLLAKWAVLSVTGLLAVTAAVGGFFVLRQIAAGKGSGFGKLCLGTILILWICSQGMYLFHLCVCLRWSGNISICVGVLQSVLAALLHTGLGDGIWQFFLCAWGGRWSSCLLLYTCDHAVLSGVPGDLAVSAGVMIIWITGTFVWFRYFEGRHLDD